MEILLNPPFTKGGGHGNPPQSPLYKGGRPWKSSSVSPLQRGEARKETVNCEP